MRFFRKKERNILVLKVHAPLTQDQAARLKIAADSIIGECGLVALVLDQSVSAHIITSKMEVQSFQPLGALP
jgi:hypothetical protein